MRSVLVLCALQLPKSFVDCHNVMSVLATGQSRLLWDSVFVMTIKHCDFGQAQPMLHQGSAFYPKVQRTL